MFCSNCGAKSSGNFCSGCGAALQSASPTNTLQKSGLSALLHNAAIQARVKSAAQRAPTKMSGEEFLKKASSFLDTGISIEKIAPAASAYFTKLGVKTGKSTTEHLQRSVEETFVAVLCGLAAGGLTIKTLNDALDGCFIQATIPSDMFSFEGTLFVTIQKESGSTKVEATTYIAGQLFDWGKSARLLKNFFYEVRQG